MQSEQQNPNVLYVVCESTIVSSIAWYNYLSTALVLHHNKSDKGTKIVKRLGKISADGHFFEITPLPHTTKKRNPTCIHTYSYIKIILHIHINIRYCTYLPSIIHTLLIYPVYLIGLQTRLIQKLRGLGAGHGGR